MKLLTITEAATARWRSRCPCCRRPMTAPPRQVGSTLASTARTAGHNVAVSFTKHAHDLHLYVFICHACNVEQGALTFEAWAALLEREGDARAAYVREVAALFEEWRYVHVPRTKRDKRLRFAYERSNL